MALSRLGTPISMTATHAGPRSAGLLDRIESSHAADRLSDAAAKVSETIVPERAGLLRGERLSHSVHPPLTDVPIGCWTSASILDLVGGSEARRPATLLVGTGVA